MLAEKRLWGEGKTIERRVSLSQIVSAEGFTPPRPPDPRLFLVLGPTRRGSPDLRIAALTYLWSPWVAGRLRFLLPQALAMRQSEQRAPASGRQLPFQRG